MHPCRRIPRQAASRAQEVTQANALRAEALAAKLQANRYITVTLPLHYRYVTIALAAKLQANRYITVTLPLHYRYVTIALAAKLQANRYITVTLPLH